MSLLIGRAFQSTAKRHRFGNIALQRRTILLLSRAQSLDPCLQCAPF